MALTLPYATHQETVTHTLDEPTGAVLVAALRVALLATKPYASDAIPPRRSTIKVARAHRGLDRVVTVPLGIQSGMA